MKVVILGYGQMLANLVAGCLESENCEIVGVFRYDKVRHPFIDRFLLDVFNPSLEYNYIKSHKLYEIKARSANSVDFKKEIIRLGADIVFVGTWGEKLKKNIITLPKLATINVHPALLPKYRGPNPYLQAIKHLESQSGVTFHLMDENFDTGAILQQNIVDIKPSDTGEELRERIALCAKTSVKELIERLNDDVIIPLNQDEKKANYYKQISEDEVMLDFSKTAEEIHAHIRAFYPWYKCYFQYGKEFFIPNPYKLTIMEAKNEKAKYGEIVKADAKTRSITVACGDKKLLKMDDVKLYGPFQKIIASLYINIIQKTVKN